MRVLLRNIRTGFYYRGGFEWTSDRDQALDLGRTEDALKLAAEFRLRAAEVVLAFDDPMDDVVLPCVGPWWKN
jgi:hypothetical protein